jgi:hypothetical protein
MPRKKSPVTPLGIDPGTFRLVAQCLNHYATPGPVSCYYGQRNERETAFVSSSTQLLKINPLQYYKSFIFPTQHVIVYLRIIVTVQQTTILGQSGNSIKNTWKFVKCGAEEGRRRSVWPIVQEMKKYCKKSPGRQQHTSCHETKES